MHKSSLSRRKFLAQSATLAATVAAGPLCEGEGLQGGAQGGGDRAPKKQQQPVTRIIAEWVVASQRDSIPAAVRKEAVRSVVNVIGATVGGSADPTVTTAIKALSPYSGPAKASLFGRPEKLDVLNAALVNGISSHVLDFDDTELNTIIHPSGVVAFALLGLAADHPMTG